MHSHGFPGARAHRRGVVGLILLFTLATVGMSVSDAQAQSRTLVQGRVQEREADGSIGDGLSGARVVFARSGRTFTTQTQANGSYSIPLPGGTYDVTASRSGYDVRRTRIVASGQRQTLNVFLYQALETSRETVNAGVDRVIRDEMHKQEIVGVAVGIVRDGEVVHLKAYGHEDIERERPVSLSTTFPWASISKPLTAVATLQLIQRGEMARSQKVHTHVSNWPSSGQKGDVTIEHLLTNRGGIKQYDDFIRSDSYRPSRYTDRRSDFNAAQSVSVFREAALFSNPGATYHYSSFGFNLLGAAVDDAADGGYVGWIEKNVAEPLAMRSLAPKTSQFQGYKRDCAGVPQLETTGDDRWKLPGGGWTSNVGDLLRFANGIVTNRLLRDTNTLWTDVPGNNTYGYGINHASSGSTLRVWHGGSHKNARSLLYLFPSDRTAVVILSNTGHLNTMRLLHHIAAEIGKDWWNDPTTPVVQCNGDGDACSGRGRYSGVWRRTGTTRARGVVVRRGYSPAAFGAAWRFLRSDGYVATDFEAYTEGGSLRWDGVFQKESGSQAMWRNFSQDAFNRKWREERARGMHLVDLETYTLSGRRYWAGLFRPGTGRTALFRNYSTDGFGQKRSELQGQGYRLIDVEAYTIDGSLRWAGVWDEGPKDVLNRNYSTDAFGDLRERREEQGYRLVDVESYRVDGDLKWAGIWERDSAPEKINRRWSEYCKLINERFVPYRNSGYELIDLERE